jgi:demethylmenaquinone methyltransferase/2-methoxy-6-polyprenyl-1,4-benzoquinol methylase
MFDRIAPVYDAMNTLMTLGLDRRWRRAAARAAGLRPGMRAVDVACGTGALTRLLAEAVAPTGEVLGVDVSSAMLARAARRPPMGARFVRADALALPLVSASVDAATIAFGLRNVTDYAGCLAEMARVVRPGGRVVVLEIALPAGDLGARAAAAWFGHVVPLLGRAAGDAAAYRYLPDSVRSYPPPVEVAHLLRAAGLREVRWRRLGPGLVTLHAARRA